MSKEAWFRHFERLQARYPSVPNDVLAEVARDAEREEIAMRIDAARLAAEAERDRLAAALAQAEAARSEAQRTLRRLMDEVAMAAPLINSFDGVWRAYADACKVMPDPENDANV